MTPRPCAPSPSPEDRRGLRSLRHLCFPQFLRGFRAALAGLSSALLSALLFAGPAHATGSGMPWEAPLTRILNSIEGPVARIVAVIIITVTGLTLAFGDTSGGFRRLVQIVFGLSIAFAATSFFLTFFSFAGGALAP